MNKRYQFAAGLLLATSLTAFADVKINDSLSFGGYAVGSYTVNDPSGGPSTDRFDMDAVKTTFTGTFKPVTGTLSLLYPGPSGSDITVLDSFFTYDLGGGSSITAGKFLSYLGYEAFDAVNMAQITYAPVTAGTLAWIPAYHSGVRYDYSDAAWSFGAAILDAVNGPTIFKGDAELKKNVGFEVYAKYTAIPKLVIWAGVAHDTEGDPKATPAFPPLHSTTTWDFWTEYKLSDTSTVAAEFAVKNGGTGVRGDSWLLYWNEAFSKTFSTTFRVGGQELSKSTVKATGASDYVQYTISPTWKVNDNFSTRAEWSYYDMDNGTSRNFFGIQALFKF
jgi:hypothetical protein